MFGIAKYKIIYCFSENLQPTTWNNLSIFALIKIEINRWENVQKKFSHPINGLLASIGDWVAGWTSTTFRFVVTRCGIEVTVVCFNDGLLLISSLAAGLSFIFLPETVKSYVRLLSWLRLASFGYAMYIKNQKFRTIVFRTLKFRTINLAQKGEFLTKAVRNIWN